MDEVKRKESFVIGKISDVKDLGGVKFLRLETAGALPAKLQVVFKGGETPSDIMEKFGELKAGLFIVVEGRLQKNQKAPGDIELIIRKLKLSD